MTEPWGSSPSPQPPAPPAETRSRGVGSDAYRTASEAGQRSRAFRDTLIVAAVAVAGVVGLIVWSGGDVAVGDGSAPPADADGQTGPLGLGAEHP